MATDRFGKSADAKVRKEELDIVMDIGRIYIDVYSEGLIVASAADTEAFEIVAFPKIISATRRMEAVLFRLRDRISTRVVSLAEHNPIKRRTVCGHYVSSI